VSNGKLNSNKCDGILQQFSGVVAHAILPNKDTFMQFGPFDAGQRLDLLLRKHMDKPEFSDFDTCGVFLVS